jgi:hypothetical protein
MVGNTFPPTNGYIQAPGDGLYVPDGEAFLESEAQAIFDTSDVDYLVTHLTPEQLRKEIHHADVEQSVAKTFGEDGNALYWEDFAKACELALDKQKSMQPKRQVRKGKFSIQAIKEVNDIEDVVRRYTTLKGRDTQYYGHCPFHQDHAPSLSVDTKKQLWHCFGCGKGGDVIDFIKLAENLDTKGAIEVLARRT